MTRDENIILMGEDIGESGGIFAQAPDPDPSPAGLIANVYAQTGGA